MTTTILGQLHRRFFAAEQPDTEVLVRTLLGALICWWSLSWLLDARSLLSDSSIFPTEAGRRFSWTLFFAGSPAWWVTLVLLGIAAVGVSLTLGRASRIGVVIAFIGVTSIQRLQPAAINAGDQLLRLILMWAVVALFLGSHSTLTGNLSAPGRERPRLFVASVRLQVIVVYCTSVIWKLQGSTWRQGEAVYAALHNPSVASVPMPSLLSETVLGTTALTYLVLLTELVLPILLVTRPRVGVATSVALHLVFAIFLRVGIFTPIMIVAVLAFLPPSDVRAGLDRVFRRQPGSTAAGGSAIWSRNSRA